MLGSVRWHRGFTLAEIIVALGFLTVVLLSLMGLLTSHYAMQSKSEESLAAGHLALAQMESWKSRPFSELAALVSSPAPPIDLVRDGREYRCRLQVTPHPASAPQMRLLHLSVRLDWQESTSLSGLGGVTARPAFFELESLVAPGAAL